ncbi:Protein of uncharacterised function (DUF3606) [Mycobacterium tuberculosis]|jgi:hypothetical protein|nr:Protein of uncharacterised function (DUF3606) [Mycobacterium tuberculosis]
MPGSSRAGTREFDVTDEQLTEAIAKVGDKAADVELYVKGSRSSTTRTP